MGRAFEFRKARKMKRWSAMAKTFTRIGKDIVMAVKEGGPNAETNSRLRAVIQNAKAANMPKDNVERAIKKATDKDTANYKEVLFEGYAPHGIAILLETATDNNNRTVANVRAAFNKCDGNLGTSGSVVFMFDHTCNFTIKKEDDWNTQFWAGYSGDWMYYIIAFSFVPGFSFSSSSWFSSSLASLHVPSSHVSVSGFRKLLMRSFSVILVSIQPRTELRPCVRERALRTGKFEINQGSRALDRFYP